MRQDQRAPFSTPLERARAAAFPAGEYVGQASFMRAGQVRTLAHRARVGRGVSVLDLCCGVSGPGRMTTAEPGCRIDHSASALAITRKLASNLPLPLRAGSHPAAARGPLSGGLLLETMLAFHDKDALANEVARVLDAGGRFAFTVEEGRPPTEQERALMPGAHAVWPIQLAKLTDVLGEAGLTVTWRLECSSSHQATAAALLRCDRADSLQIATQIGTLATAELISSHQLWSGWLGNGRVRKFAMVAEKQ